MNSPIQRIFTHLDITSQQSRLYLTLLNTGPLSITQLSKQLNSPRTTIHENIEKLIQKGLVVKTVQGSTKKLIADPPPPNSKKKFLLPPKFAPILAVLEFRKSSQDNYILFTEAHARNKKQMLWEIITLAELDYEEYIPQFNAKRYFPKDVSPVTINSLPQHRLTRFLITKWLASPSPTTSWPQASIIPFTPRKPEPYLNLSGICSQIKNKHPKIFYTNHFSGIITQ